MNSLDIFRKTSYTEVMKMFGKLKLKGSKELEQIKDVDKANEEAPYSHLPSTVENNNFGTSLADQNYEDNSNDNAK